MKSAILGLGTAVPEYCYQQDQLSHAVISALEMNTLRSKWYQKICEHSAIQTRYSVIPDLDETVNTGKFLGSSISTTSPSFSFRNEIFKREAPRLAHKAASQAIHDWGGNPGSITHIVSVTCTGVVCPGIEVSLIQSLNLDYSVERVAVNFMGCFGAFKGLAVAQALANENPRNRILLVCTELCSLHLHKTESRETLIGNALFADGAASVIVGAEPKSFENPVWEIEKRASHIFPDSQNEMTWETGDTALVMRLTREVPRMIRDGVREFLAGLLQPDLTFDDCDWALHPGGKSILENIEESCGIGREQTAASWEVLSKYGNMSSPTFLFVLDQMRSRSSRKQWTIGAGFGPGLAMEGVLLRRVG